MLEVTPPDPDYDFIACHLCCRGAVITLVVALSAASCMVQRHQLPLKLGGDNVPV